MPQVLAWIGIMNNGDAKLVGVGGAGGAGKYSNEQGMGMGHIKGCPPF